VRRCAGVFDFNVDYQFSFSECDATVFEIVPPFFGALAAIQQLASKPSRISKRSG